MVFNRHHVSMDEKKIISQLNKIKRIQPDKDWQVSLRNEIIGEDVTVKNLFSHSVLATASVFGLIAVMFVSAQNTVPGDSLYALKQVTEKTQRILSADKANFELNLAEKKIENLARVRIEHRDKGIVELRETKSRAEKEVVRSLTELSPEIAIEKAREVAPSLVNLREKEVLAVGSLEEEANGDSEKMIAEILISDLESRTLTDSQLIMIQEAREKIEQEQYFEAMKIAMSIENITDEVVEEETPEDPEKDTEIETEDN